MFTPGGPQLLPLGTQQKGSWVLQKVWSQEGSFWLLECGCWGRPRHGCLGQGYNFSIYFAEKGVLQQLLHSFLMPSLGMSNVEWTL